MSNNTPHNAQSNSEEALANDPSITKEAFSELEARQSQDPEVETASEADEGSADAEEG